MKFLLILLFTPLLINAQSWDLLGIDISSNNENEQFGSSIDINYAGDRMVVGAPIDDEGGDNAGMVKVYEFTNGFWEQLGADIEAESLLDYFGTSVAINALGDRIVAGAFGNEGGGNQSGHVRVFEWNGSSWIQVGNDIDGRNRFDHSGISVAINASGNRIAIGANQNDNVIGVHAGHVRIYEFIDTDWEQIGGDIYGEAAYDGFGRTLDMNLAGDIIISGAYGNDANGDASGHARVFKFNDNNWEQMGDDLDGDSEGDLFGISVSINHTGNIVAIGSSKNSDNTGQVKIFEWNGVLWNQIGQDLLGKTDGENFGRSVSLNSNGEILVVGAPQNSGGKGLARVFRYLDQTWVEFGNELKFFFGGGDDEFGTAVTINSLGDRVAVGGPYGSGEYSFIQSGFVKVYELDDSTILDVDNFVHHEDFDLIFFNSVSNKIELKSEEIMNISIFNLEGELVLNDNFNKNKEVDLSSLAIGVYVLKVIYNSNNVSTLKFVKIK